MSAPNNGPAKPPEGGAGAGESNGLSRELTVATPTPGSVPPSSGGPSLGFGTTLDHFEIGQLLGAGGMGEVYRARDIRLERTVAIKVLPQDFAQDADRRERFRREAMAASALNHRNICTVHDLIEADGRHLIVMEFVEGRTLHQLVSKGPLPTAQILAISRQIAAALGEAHRAGILHRDIKSGNIILTPRNEVKVLDFGLAKRLVPSRAADTAAPELTREGMALGTLTYMSPEQLLGKTLDARSDLFSLGVVMYEMATRRLPFGGSTGVAIADSILHSPPRSLSDAAIPERLKAAILRLLEKDPAKRFASADELQTELAAIEASLAPARPGRLSKATLALLAAVGIGVVVLGGWFWHRTARVRWVRETAVPQAEKLVTAEDFEKAYPILREARSVIPNDPTVEKLWNQATLEVMVESTPPDADVFYRSYRGNPGGWTHAGKTPLKGLRVPRDFFLWRIDKPGFDSAWQIAPTWSVLFSVPLQLSQRLVPQGSVPPDMVRVPGGKVDLAIPELTGLPPVTVDDFVIDRFEVTNQSYKKFVDAGGYKKREFWKQPFVKNGKTISWDEAMALFHDATGRPGPAVWELGSYPTGLEKHPVAGVSWFEAAAYAEFSGKGLPTVFHWNQAGQTRASMLISPESNFQGTATLPVDPNRAISGFGTTDMAGNVKEWCWNETSGGKRFILGGGFGEPTYMFIDQDAQSPWERQANYGFRCVKLPAPASAAALARLDQTIRDYSKEKPVSDEVFAAYRGLYKYDKGPLDARVEQTETTDDWRHEKISFNAAYGNERVIAHLYLPKNAKPPFQTVIYFPGSNAWTQDKFVLSRYVDFIPKSGRALLAPVYKSTFDRRDDLNDDTYLASASWRDHMILWSKDLGRSLDYLQSRTDIDHDRIAYFGLSWGSEVAPVMLAVENRFKAAVLESGGLDFGKPLPEADQLNFITRVRLPVLMLNGRYDHFFPVDSSQVPFFRLLGTPGKDKKQIIYETGHAVPRKDFIRESLDWLDKYLGPVQN
jgi:formylglycine-generating enzyme required for sulfatase activity/dienelactone hydrolase/predicted Ser/Thr protein kinase